MTTFVALAIALVALPAPAASPEAALQEAARRQAAVVRLGVLGKDADLQRLLPYLDDPDDSLRVTAERWLLRAGNAAAVQRVVARAQDPQAPIRLEALTTLRAATTLPPAARQAGERALIDSDPTLRLAGIGLLSGHPSSESLPRVMSALYDGNRDVRLAAIRWLRLLGDGRATLALLDRIDVPDRGERIAVMEALAALGKHPRLDPGPALVRQLSDSDEDTRLGAIEVLGQMRLGAAVPALRQIAQHPTRGGATSRAILALGAIGDEAAVDALVDLLAAPAPAPEVEAALVRAGPRAIPRVASLLATARPESAATAARILGHIAGGSNDVRPALAPLVAALKERPLVAPPAATALGQLCDGDAVPALAQVAEGVLAKGAARAPASTPGPVGREAAFEALAVIGDRRASRAVEAGARDGDPTVRAAALRLAAAVHGGLSATTLRARLTDEDPSVRDAAIAAAWALPGDAAAAPLVESASRWTGPWSPEARQLADALAAKTSVSDRPMLLDGLSRAAGAGRIILAGTLAAAPGNAAHGPAPALPATVQARLVEWATATEDPRLAHAAAGALSSAPVSETTALRIAAALPRLPATTRARVCPALAHTGSARADEALAAVIEVDIDAGVRAAAAWSAVSRGANPRLRAALERARRSGEPRVASNARAALALALAGSGAAPASAAPSWVGIRLRTPAGDPAPHRWVRVRIGSAPAPDEIWALTDDDGEARIYDLPPGPVLVAADPDDQATLTAATASGRSPATTPGDPCSRAARVPAAP